MNFGALIVILFILFFISSSANKNKKKGFADTNKIKEQIGKKTKQEAPSSKQNIWDILDEKETISQEKTESVTKKPDENLDVNLNLNFEENLNLNTIKVNNEPYKKDINNEHISVNTQIDNSKEQKPEKPAKPKNPKVLSSSKNSLKNGVIWSEILSKPIALR